MPFWWSTPAPRASDALARRVRVLVIDESALMRELLVALLVRDPQIEVVAAVADPRAAFARLKQSQVDVITLDVEMPRLDALAFLDTLMRTYPRPVVTISALTDHGAATTFRALELGAVDFVARPQIDLATGTLDLAAEIVRKVKGAAGARLRPLGGAAAAGRPATTVAWEGLTTRAPKVVAIGASTGGAEALRVLLGALPHDSPGIAVVHHMPARFTQALAQRLDSLCALHVSEAKAGDRVRPGHVLLAPGDSHMQVVRSGEHFVTRIFSAEPVYGQRPSADILFRSCAQYLGANAVGIVLTGTGSDGARGLRAMRDAGAHTIAQDEETCVAFGTPKEAIALGGVDEVLALEKIPAAALRATAKF